MIHSAGVRDNDASRCERGEGEGCSLELLRGGRDALRSGEERVPRPLMSRRGAGGGRGAGRGGWGGGRG